MVEKQAQPWEKIAWSDESLQIIYRECGNNLMRKQKLKVAIHYFEKSLELRDDDPKALYFLSLCQKYIALCESSYNAAIRGLSALDTNQPLNLQVCNALYDLNDLESAGLELKSKGRRFTGHKIKAFQEKFEIVESNLSESLGESLFQFIQEYKQYFKTIVAIRDKLENPDERPRWKILRDNNECDILSIFEEFEQLVHPRERARLARGYKIFNQKYLNNSAIDVGFLKFLKTNKTLLLPQSTITPILKEVADSNYNMVIKFMRMLQARNPLYNERLKRCPDKERCRKEKADNLSRIQYTTRRMMFIILFNIKRLREQGNIYELSRYIEQVMGDYVILKTNRMMPWKFEFINEVYNILALAYIDQIYIPKYLDAFDSSKEKLYALLRVPLQDERLTINQFNFGDKSTWVEPEAIDYSYIRYNKLIQRLEKRILFVQYPIEKCYLCFEISKNHLIQNKFDECITMSRKAFGDAETSRNIVWKFLLTFIIFKALVVQEKIEKAKEFIADLKNISALLANETIPKFMTLAESFLVNEIKQKVIAQAQQSITSKKSRGQSMYSNASEQLSTGGN
ncbi:hypothetical protein ACFFRR_001535 [Megaselia abdita]